MATFDQAIIWMHEGHKVKRKSQRVIGSYFHIEDGQLKAHDGEIPLLTLYSFDAKDWVIFEEEKE